MPKLSQDQLAYVCSLVTMVPALDSHESTSLSHILIVC